MQTVTQVGRELTTFEGDPSRPPAGWHRGYRWAVSGAVMLVLSLLLVGCRGDASFPNRPITLICPWSAGGGSDRVARQIAAQLERELGVPVNVINATGGGGVTGHTRGAQARPDGYTLTLITAELTMLHWRGLTNVTYEDFQPLTLVNRDNAALFVREEAPWGSLDDLEQAIREQPGELRASGTAFGGIWHLSLAGWLIEMGLSADAVTWVSLDGSAPSLQELMAGGVSLVACSVPEAQSLLEAGRIRSLGVMAPERLPGYSGIPTFSEQGADWTSGTWRGLALPEGVPDERARVLSEAVQQVISSDEYRSFLESAGFGPPDLPPERFEAFLQRQDQQNGAVLTSDAFAAVQSQQYGPWLFPSIVIGLLVLTIAPLAWRGKLTVPADAQTLTWSGVGRVSLAVGAVGFYIVAAEMLGYLLTMALLLAVLFWRYRAKWYVAGAVTLILVPLTYQLFAVYLRVPLPWGWLGW
mgnify:FL=1